MTFVRGGLPRLGVCNWGEAAWGGGGGGWGGGLVGLGGGGPCSGAGDTRKSDGERGAEQWVVGGRVGWSEVGYYTTGVGRFFLVARVRLGGPNGGVWVLGEQHGGWVLISQI